MKTRTLAIASAIAFATAIPSHAQEPTDAGAAAPAAAVSAEDRVNQVRAEKLRQAELDHRSEVVSKKREQELAELEADNKKLEADRARAEAEIARAAADKAKAELEAKSPGAAAGAAAAASAPPVMTREEAQAMIDSALAARRAEQRPQMQMSPAMLGGMGNADFGRPALSLVGLIGEDRALFVGRNDIVIEAQVGDQIEGYRFAKVVKDGAVVTMNGQETTLRIGARK